MGREATHQTRLLKTPSNLALNTSRDGASTASLGSLCQCLTTLRVKNFFWIETPFVTTPQLQLIVSSVLTLTVLWQQLWPESQLKDSMVWVNEELVHKLGHKGGTTELTAPSCSSSKFKPLLFPLLYFPFLSFTLCTHSLSSLNLPFHLFSSSEGKSIQRT